MLIKLIDWATRKFIGGTPPKNQRVDWQDRMKLPSATISEPFMGRDIIVRFAKVTPLNDFLAVTFHSASIDEEGPRKAGFDMPGFGQSFLRKHGINAVHVLVSRSHWYQTPEMEGALAFIRHIAKDYHRVVTYGSSMGGYAAIKFGPEVRANAAVAISPQYSIDPAKAPFEKRFLKYFRREAWTNDTFVRDAH